MAALRRLFRRSSLSNDEDREALLANPEALELPDDAVSAGRTRVAVADDGAILGFITAIPFGAGILELEDLFVDPGWMRHGVARSLIADVIAAARRDGISSIEVTANPHANAFYRRVGFVHVRDVATRFGPGSRMQLVVPGDPAAESSDASH